MTDDQVDIELEIPHISWDTFRITNQPTVTSQPSPTPPSFDPTPVPSHHPSPSPTLDPTPPYPSYVPTSAPLLSRTSAPVTLAPVTPRPSYSFYRVTIAPVTQSMDTFLPVTPSPVTPSPVTPSPVAPSPVTPSPVTPSPVTPSPVTPSPVAPSPVAPSPVTQSPTVISSESLAPSLSTAIISETPKSPSSPDEVRTYYSCPPPPTETVQYGTTLVEIGPQISSVGIPYGFQVQLSKDEDIITILPSIESQLESTLGEYMRSHTEDGYDENQCAGYHVEDFRIRKLTNTTTGAEDAPTKIIAISRAKSMSLDEKQQCEPQNENCYVIYGVLEATYVGNNEAGVKSSISRVIKEEVVQQAEYDIHYRPVDDETYDYASPDTSDIIPVVVSSAQEAEPESIIESSRITPYGKVILVALGSAFIVLCFVLSTKGVGPKKRKNTKREIKNADSTALGGDDDLKQLKKEGHSYDLESVDEEDRCYDLESVQSYHGEDSEGGFEVKSPRKSGLIGNTNAATAAASIAVGSVASSHDSGKTKKWWNRADDSARVAAVATTTASAVAVERGRGETKKWWGKADDDSAKFDAAAAAASTPATTSASISAVAVINVDSNRDTGKIKKWWNKANDNAIVAGRAKVANAIPAAGATTTGVDSVANSYDSTNTKKMPNEEDDTLKYDSLVVVKDVDEESCASDDEKVFNVVPPPGREREAGNQFLSSLPNFLRKGGGMPLVDRLPSTQSEKSNGSRASQKSSGLSHGSGLTYNWSPKMLNPTTNSQLSSISEAGLRPSNMDTPRVSFAQLPRNRNDSPSGFSRCSSRGSKYDFSVTTEYGTGEI